MDKYLHHPYATNELNKHVENQIITKVWRRGKYIILDLSNGHLCIHLRMTGQLQVGNSINDNPKHFTALIKLKNKSTEQKLKKHLVFKLGAFYIQKS